ncbi:sigma-70 family RNA polymerase sigma factor [Agrobacterium sp. S2/73]|uniref:RNA polymerase sigma factor n=1 Tax=Agrobacterium TaxID=357 RepID=UPI000DD93997|nr:MULTISPECIES: sigma-70 family RNA polymerase sigma factor [unclassified Agrobacterium]MBO9112128.1 sigma-70 family RNA polymerase sigma factor [Agrobacterium sp. S2/73]NTA13444.1 sigma-70 family RNA polymerase sigma factor [Agrobacterium tumefaciens]QXZ76473.1 sigma-70 family RNA polymerase sigma factor [Agrobacterium sp. S7/73]
MRMSTASLNESSGTDLLNRAIVEHYSDIIKAVGGRNRSDGAAREIVHDLYVKLALQPDALSGKRSIKAFLCRAASNMRIDRIRREQFESRLFSGSDEDARGMIATDSAPDQGLDVEARLAILKQAIADLPEKRRTAFVLHRLHHFTPDQIASKLKISRNMVDRHLRRALSHCLDRLFEME